MFCESLGPMQVADHREGHSSSCLRVKRIGRQAQRELCTLACSRNVAEFRVERCFVVRRRSSIVRESLVQSRCPGLIKKLLHLAALPESRRRPRLFIEVVRPERFVFEPIYFPLLSGSVCFAESDSIQCQMDAETILVGRDGFFGYGLGFRESTGSQICSRKGIIRKPVIGVETQGLLSWLNGLLRPADPEVLC